MNEERCHQTATTTEATVVYKTGDGSASTICRIREGTFFFSSVTSRHRKEYRAGHVQYRQQSTLTQCASQQLRVTTSGTEFAVRRLMDRRHDTSFALVRMAAVSSKVWVRPAEHAVPGATTRDKIVTLRFTG